MRFSMISQVSSLIILIFSRTAVFACTVNECPTDLKPTNGACDVDKAPKGNAMLQHAFGNDMISAGLKQEEKHQSQVYAFTQTSNATGARIESFLSANDVTPSVLDTQPLTKFIPTIHASTDSNVSLQVPPPALEVGNMSIPIGRRSTVSDAHPWAVATISHEPHQAFFFTHRHSLATSHETLRLIVIALLSFFFIWSALSPTVSTYMLITCWMSASMTMNVVNKEVAIGFSSSTYPVVMQMIFGIGMFTFVEWKNLKVGKAQCLWKWSVVPVFFAGMLYTSIQSLKYLSLSSVLILRNVMPLFTLCCEKAMYNKPAKITNGIVLSMLMTFFGIVLYGAWQVTVTRIGVFYVVINCAVTIADRLLQSHFLRDPNFTVSLPLCIVWNNLLGVLPIVALAMLNGQLITWPRMVLGASVEDWSSLFFSCTCGCSLGYLGLRCQKVVSATTFLILQNFSKMFLIFVSMAYFGDGMRDVSAFGCCLSMLGTMWYSYDRLPVETAEYNKDASDTSMKLQSSADIKRSRAATF